MKKILLTAFFSVLGLGLAHGQISISYYFDAEENTPPAPLVEDSETVVAGGTSSLTTASFNALNAIGLSASNRVDFESARSVSNSGTRREGSSWPWTQANELTHVYTFGNQQAFNQTTADPGNGGPGDFFSFTLENSSGSNFLIQEFNYAIGLQNGGSGALYHYAEIIIDDISVWNSGNVTEGPRSFVTTTLGHGFDLTAEGLSITDGKSAEFRVYYASNRTSQDQLAIANLEAVVIPEPSTYAAIFGLTALSLIVWRRRKVK